MPQVDGSNQERAGFYSVQRSNTQTLDIAGVFNASNRLVVIKAQCNKVLQPTVKSVTPFAYTKVAPLSSAVEREC